MDGVSVTIGINRYQGVSAMKGSSVVKEREKERNEKSIQKDEASRQRRKKSRWGWSGDGESGRGKRRKNRAEKKRVCGPKCQETPGPRWQDPGGAGSACWIGTSARDVKRERTHAHTHGGTIFRPFSFPPTPSLSSPSPSPSPPTPTSPACRQSKTPRSICHAVAILAKWTVNAHSSNRW